MLSEKNICVLLRLSLRSFPNVAFKTAHEETVFCLVANESVQINFLVCFDLRSRRCYPPLLSLLRFIETSVRQVIRAKHR